MKRLRKKRKKKNALILSHLKNIKRALLEGEKRPAFLEFLKTTGESRGLYALYNNKGRIYYFGKASELRTRINHHLSDKHKDNWDQMTLFFLTDNANVSELEGLVIASARPSGNTQSPKIGYDKRQKLKKFLKDDAINQINQVVYPEKKEKNNSLSARITGKKLRQLTQQQLAKGLALSQGRVSQLINRDKKHYSAIHSYIKEAGRRDSILLLFDKLKVK